MKVLCLLATLFVIAASAPVETIGDCQSFYGDKPAKAAISLWKEVTKIKDPNFFDSPQFKAIEIGVDDMVKTVLSGKAFVEHMTEEQVRQFVTLYNITTALKAIVGEAITFLKATVPEGANPTEEELMIMAKTMSDIFKGTDFRLDYFTNKAIMSNATVTALQKLVRENPLKESGNDIMDKMKDAIPRLYKIALKLRKFKGRTIFNAFSDNSKVEKDVDYKEYILLFCLSEVDFFMQIDENVIELYKYLAALMKAIKNPETYNSLTSIYENFAKSERLEAYAIWVKEIAKCLGNRLSEEDKVEFHEHIPYALKVMKAVFADGQKTTPESITELICNDEDHLFKLQIIILKLGLDKQEGKDFALKCIVSDNDEAVFREYLDFSKTIFTKEELNEIRAKNEKVYAIYRIVNGIVRALQRENPTAIQIDVFMRKVLSTPHLASQFFKLFRTSQEIDQLVKAAENDLIEEFNNLPADIKDLLVDMYPYRAVNKIALLD